jgi:hypothetical protein
MAGSLVLVHCEKRRRPSAFLSFQKLFCREPPFPINSRVIVRICPEYERIVLFNSSKQMFFASFYILLAESADVRY